MAPSPVGPRPGAVRHARGSHVPGRPKMIASREARRRPGQPGHQYAETRHNIGWMVLDRLADRAGWAGRAASATPRDRQGRYSGPRPRAREAPDLHERLRPRGPQAARPRSRAAASTSSSSPTTSPCRSASCGSARAAAPAVTTGCARSSTSWGPRSSAGCASASASRGAAPSTTSCRVRTRRAGSGSTSSSMQPPTRSRPGRGTGRARPPTGSTPSSSVPADADRAAAPGRGRRPGRDRWRPPDEDRLALASSSASPTGTDKGSGPVSDRYRGRTTRQRTSPRRSPRDWAERRAAGGGRRAEIDLDRAEAEAEVELSSARARGPRRRAARAEPARAASARRGATAAAVQRPRGAGRRVPDLAALPPLLHATGSFASLRERLGPPVAEPRPARPARRPDVGPARREVVPRGGARLVAPAGSGSAGSRATRRSATASRRSSARGSATRRSSPSWSRGRRSPTSAASSSPDETAARVAALAAWRSGRARRSSSRASRRWSSRRSRPTTCRPSRAS